MKTRTEQMIYVFVAALIMAMFMYFVKSETVLGAISVAFVGAIGLFLGVDLRKMLKDTSSLPKGQFKRINKYRYIITLVLFAALLTEAFIIQKATEISMVGIYGSIGVGFMLVLGLLISGIEANKIKTQEEP